MQSWIRARLHLVGATLFALGATVAVASAQEKILRWHDSLDRGAQTARESGKPLFVVFRCVR
jgi:hypothetical protein